MVDNVRVTQQYVEVLSDGDPADKKVRVTQQYLEVLHSSAFVPGFPAGKRQIIVVTS